MPQQVDYAALAAQARKQASAPVDYAALAEQARKTSAATPARTPGRPRGPATIGEMVRTPAAGRGTNIDLTRSYDAAGGVRAGAASTMYHGGDAIRRALGMDRVIDEPDVQAAITPPDSTAGRAGFMTEQAAEFAVPMARVGKAVSKSGLFTRAVAEGAAAAGVAGVQSGGEPGAMLGAGTVGAVLPPAGAALRAGGGVVQRAAAGAKENGLGGAIAATVRNVAPGEPRTLLVQALKPRSTRTNFPGALDRAIPEMKAAERAIGKPIENLDDLLAASKAAKADIQSQLNQLRGAQRDIGATVDGSSVADAMTKSIPKKLQLERPAAALRLQKSAEVYRRSFTLDEAETLLRETNAQLDGFYQMYPQAQRTATTANPATATLDAQAKALRDVIYAKLDEPGQGAAARELNRRWGALNEVEREAVRRANVAARQQPESLSEQIGAVRAAGEMARGLWRLTHGDLAGAADIAAARAGRSAATAIKESQTTDALIRRAFAGYRGSRVPVLMPSHGGTP